MSLEEPGTSEVVGELQPCRGEEEFQPQLIDEAHEFIKESTSSQLPLTERVTTVECGSQTEMSVS